MVVPVQNPAVMEYFEPTVMEYSDVVLGASDLNFGTFQEPKSSHEPKDQKLLWLLVSGNFLAFGFQEAQTNMPLFLSLTSYHFRFSNANSTTGLSILASGRNN